MRKTTWLAVVALLAAASITAGTVTPQCVPTATPTQCVTPTRTATRTPTSTPIPPTKTPTKTKTPIPPTATPTITQTPTATATITPTPYIPHATPTWPPAVTPFPTPTRPPTSECPEFCYPPWLQVGLLFKIPELDKLYPCEARCDVIWQVMDMGQTGWLVVRANGDHVDVRVNFAELKFLVQVQ